ncbi:hypothetical protein MHO82_24595 [Vibrio sp. Of7-15]|uniref:hypothetical protein n=1 Tax=Vibrio sp. Of7-15 TaxID=2724879 RepID=UPI001EF28231|nr:hypothetical protein [Vibrio sp. Of7-15]MCG7500047.1 hypothetical protein [Vibrio sp. Of7-15]
MDKLTMPKRNSKNPVLGINRCDCGNVRTIHRPKGTRKKFLYSICDDCGTNQQTGAAIQAKMSTYFSTVEELINHEHTLETQHTEPTEPEGNEEPSHGGNLCIEHDDTGGDQQPDSSVPETTSPPKKKKAPWFAVLTGVVVGVATGGAIVRLGN